jgi:hypothetical protein
MTGAVDFDADLVAAQVIELVHRNRIPLHNEKAAQAGLETLLQAGGFEFEREARLSDADIPDFMIGGLVIEMKVKGGKRDIYRQLERYAKHERVTRILLITNVAMGLPEDIEGRKTYIANLGRAWL